MTKAVTTMCLSHPPVARSLVYHGKTVISHIPLSLSAESKRFCLQFYWAICHKPYPFPWGTLQAIHWWSPHGTARDPDSCPWSDLQKAEAAAYIATSTLTSLGYTLALSKSSLSPEQSVVRYLGYFCDSSKRAFILHAVDKKQKFKSWREHIPSQKGIDHKSLQCFAGKTTSFAIAVPATRLYTRTCYCAIGASRKNTS